MAELKVRSALAGGARLTRQQFAAIVWLRWRLLANSLRRRGGAGELILRILLIPLMLALGLLPAALAGAASAYLLQSGRANQLPLVFWAAFGLTQLLNINLGQPGTTFDPSELIRFPLTLRHYVFVRLCFGLLSPANIVVTLISAAIFLGIAIVQPSLIGWALLSTSSFALANVLFSRMVFAWVDRWLSTRRAREIFTVLIFSASLGFQYLNVNYNPGFQHGRGRRIAPERLEHAKAVLHHIHPWLQWLPPELSATTVQAALRQHPFSALSSGLLVFGYAALFLLVYAYRIRSEYMGENLSEAAVLPKSRSSETRSGSATSHSALILQKQSMEPVGRASADAVLATLFRKEILVLRRNTGLLYGVIAPTVMVFLFAGRMSIRGGSQWVLLLAVGYALLSLAPVSYNSFGLEGPGAQFYFFAPVSLERVFLAKNLMQFVLAGFETVSVVAIVGYVAGRPPALDIAFVLLWAAATLLLNTSLGNLRSISAPKKVNAGKTFNRAQSQVSAWIAIGILLSCTSVAAGLQFLAGLLHIRWLATAVMLVVAAVCLMIYRRGLQGLDTYAMERREALFEELGKKT